MLIIDACGPAFARRFFLKDGKGNFWNENGQCWTHTFQDAARFSNQDDIGERMHELMLQIPGKLQTFVAPIVVEVKAQEPVDLEALQDWLDKAVQVFLNARHGTGPTKQSMAMMRICWNHLKENTGE